MITGTKFRNKKIDVVKVEVGGSAREAPLAKLTVHPGNSDRRGVDMIAARAAVPTQDARGSVGYSCE